MKTRKLIALFICAAMSFAAAIGCGGSKEDSSTKDSTPPASSETPATSEEPEVSEEPETSEELEPILPTYTVTFVGAEVAEQTVEENGTVAKPTDPAQDYYTFDGWYNGDTLWNFETDKVTKDLTLTAKFTAKTYEVKFVDFDKNETVLTYTYETVEDFALPAVPAAPEHYENARWNKTQEECLVYSDEAIVVEAVADAKSYTVSFDTNGGEGLESVSVKYGDPLVTETPVLEGYAFKGWTLNGEAYDTSAFVTGDITLKASWCAIMDTPVKGVISAQDILDGVILEDGYGYKEEAVTANPNAGWYYDSDYNDTSGAGNVDENRFANWVKFTLTYDGGAGTSDTGRETYLVLPAINYKLYAKVDFAYNNNDNIKALNIYGTEVAQYGGKNKLISIVTDENGTKLYFREINSVNDDVTVGANAVITLPESVANGSEGLKLNITVGGRFKFAVTEFHASLIAFDYAAVMADALAILPETAEALTGSAEESKAALAYVNAEQYLTSAEREGYTTPAVVKAALEQAYYAAIENAAPGSAAQVEAIEAYRAYSETLTAEEKESATHKANVEKINALIKQTVTETLNPTLTGTNTTNGGERVSQGDAKLDYASQQYTSSHMFVFDKEGNDGSVTIGAVNYNAYEEVYFGLYVVAGAANWDPYDGVNGTVTVNGVTSGGIDPRNGDHYFKVVIKDGVLTVYDDSKDKKLGGGAVMTVELPANVANGMEGLKVDYNFGAWSQTQITEMYATSVKELAKATAINNEVTLEFSGTTEGTKLSYHETTYWGTGAHTAFQTMEYTSQNLASFNAATEAYTVTFTLPKFNFTQYDEVYFGFTAATAAGDATVTIDSKSYTYNANNGYVYVKMIIKDGVFTVVGDGANNLGQTLMAVELSEAVLNGTEALTITWSTAGWSQVEITDMQALTYLDYLA